MRMIRTISYWAAFVLIVNQPLFAQEPDAAEIVVTAEHQVDWSRGQRLEREGIDRMSRAERRIRDANERITRGESRAADAERRLNNARDEYRRLATNLDAGANSAIALRHSRQLKSAAESWAAAEERLDEGRDLINDGRSRLARAERERDQAQQRVDRGRALKTEAERASAAGATALR